MLHPIIDDSRINLARHELAHGYLAHVLGFEVHRIEDQRGHLNRNIRF